MGCCEVQVPPEEEAAEQLAALEAELEALEARVLVS